MQHSIGPVSRRRAQRLAGVVLAMALGTAVGCSDDGSGGDATGTTAAGSDTTVATGDTQPSDADSLLGPLDEAAGEPLRIGYIVDAQSTAGDNTEDLDVADAAVAYLNERKGGIGGRPIELVTCDARTDPSTATDCANQMVEEGVPLVAVGSSGVYESIWRPLHDAGVPTIFFAASGEALLADTENTFSFASPKFSNFTFPIGIAEEAGVDKVTVVVIDVPPATEPYEGVNAHMFEDAGLELELVRVPIGTADMTPNLSPVLSGDPGLIHIVGNDTFCIAALQAMQALGFDGPITAISFCFSDATTQAFPDGYLEGINSAYAAPTGEGPETELFRAVMDEYATTDIDTSRNSAVTTFILLAGIDAALEPLDDAEITPDSVISTLKAMQEIDLPGGAGIRISCDGNQEPESPAACTNDGLSSPLDAEGHPTDFELVDG